MDRFSALTDEELLRAAASDADAFAEFYDRHVVALVGVLRRRTSSSELALDLAAEVFAGALERCGAFRSQGEGSARAWLYAIARNKLADAYRSGVVDDRARRRLGMEPLVVTDRAFERLESRIDAERTGVLAALAELPDHERDAITARVVDDVSYPDIAATLDVSESVVRQRVSRGLRRLRTSMKDTR